MQDTLIYDELLDVLAETADPQRIGSFRLSQPRQSRLDDLLDKNRAGTLTEEEKAELDAFEHFEHVVRMLKVRTLQKRKH